MANFDTKNKEIEEMIGGFYSFTKYHDSFKDQKLSFARRDSDQKRSIIEKTIAKKIKRKRQFEERYLQALQNEEILYQGYEIEI